MLSFRSDGKLAIMKAYQTGDHKSIMAPLFINLFWLTILFGVMVTASYVGTTAALRTYFSDEEFGSSDFIRIGDGDR